MSTPFESVGLWLADFHLLAAVLLGAVLVARLVIRQPAQRMAVNRAALAAAAVLAALCALPGWSVIHLAQSRLAADTSSPTWPVAKNEAVVKSVKFQPPFDEAPAVQPPAMDSQSVVGAVSPPVRPTLSWAAWAVVAHGVGSLFGLAWLTIGMIAARRLRRTALPAPAGWAYLLGQLSPSVARPEVRLSESIDSPVALGVRQPSILLPAKMRDANAESLCAILAHELAHIRNGDLATLAASRALLVLLWPQPLTWILRRAIRLDQEELADAAAAEVAGRFDYAEQLVSWARTAATGPRGQAPRLAAAIGLWESPSQLKRRIATLLDEKFAVLRTATRRWRLTCGALAAAAAIGLSLVTLQPASLAQESKGASDADRGLAEDDLEVPPTRHVVFPGTGINAYIAVQNDPPVIKENTLFISVTGIDGLPLAGLEVLLYTGSYSDGIDLKSERHATDAAGKLELPNLVPPDVASRCKKTKVDGMLMSTADYGYRLIVVRGPNLATAITMVNNYDLALRGATREFQMHPAARLSGRVTNEAGKPVAGALVAAGSWAGQVALEGVNAVRTDVYGRYEFINLNVFDAEAARKEQGVWQLSIAANVADRKVPPLRPAGFDSIASDLVVSHPDFALTQVTGGDIPGKLDVTVFPGSSIVGRVASPGSEIPVANVVVQAYGNVGKPREQQVAGKVVVWAAQAQRASTRTDAGGRFRLANLPEGVYDVWADSSDRNLATTPWINRGIANVQTHAGQEADAGDLSLQKPGVVEGQLIDGDTGAPIVFPKEGARAQIVFQLVDGTRNRSQPFQRVPVSQDGKFIAGADAGSVRAFFYVYESLEDVDANKVAYLTDDAAWETGPVLDVPAGETARVAFKVYSRHRVDEERNLQSKAWKLSSERKVDEAIAAFTELLDKRPGSRDGLIGRARMYEAQGEFSKAVADYNQLPNESGADATFLSSLMKLLAASPNDADRDGARAVALAEKIVPFMRSNPNYQKAELARILSWQSMAFAETGRFDKAVETIEEAIRLAPDEKDEYKKILQLYRAGKPYRLSAPQKPVATPPADDDDSRDDAKNDATPSRSESDGEKSSGGDDALTGRFVPAVPSSDQAPTADAGEKMMEIHGRVIDPSQRPIAGSRVWLPIRSAYGQEELAEATTADEKGEFALRVPTGLLTSGNAMPRWTIWAYAPGHAIGTGSAYSALSGEASEPINVVLAAATDTAFVVWSPTGKPVAGARVNPHHIATTAAYETPPEALQRIFGGVTDENGRVELPTVSRKGFYTVEVIASGYGQQLAQLSDKGNEPAERPITLRPAGRIEGQIVTDDDAIVADRTVYVQQLSSDMRGATAGVALTSTDSHGRFTIEEFAEGEVKIGVHGDDSLPWRPRLPEGVRVTGGKTLKILIAMEPAVRVRGRIRTFGDHRPIAGALIHVGYGGFRQGEQVRSDASGRFQAFALPGQVRQQVIMHPKAFRTWTPKVSTLEETIDISKGVAEFDLPPIDEVEQFESTAHVVDRDEKPVINALVVAFAKEHRDYTGRTDANGRVSLWLPHDEVIERYMVSVPEGDGLSDAKRIGEDPLILQVGPSTAPSVTPDADDAAADPILPASGPRAPDSSIFDPKPSGSR